ncbi:DUF2066 domain-containing protein [Alteromonas confluentis]|uniref:DUF2066 domain-containing protein n=1 Tax=Alteromonas confluentis TaxID=1656094 RepID=A0A1E7Z5J7_9ALTE|nr:DUF2066 domain-containing protein [Alteromonas confluentis]OFC68681.1 hypothetical protein BFC18_01105 [Alteromonas confluentis]
MFFQRIILRFIPACVLVFTSVASVSCIASTTVSVNEASVAVENQSSRTQRAATRTALEQVVVKITGQRDALKQASVRTMLSEPQRYLRAYRFEMNNGELFYVGEFDSQTVTQELREAGLPIWGQRRPDTLIWLATQDDNSNREIISDGTANDITEALREVATERGVPVVFPLMDLDDSLSISVYDVWGRFAVSLKEASARYQPDYIVGARLYKVEENAVPDIEEAKKTQEQVRKLKYDSYRPAFSNNGLQDLNTYLVDDLVQASKAPAFSRSEFEEMGNQSQDGAYALDWVVIDNTDINFGSVYADDPAELAALFLEDYSDFLGKHFSVNTTEENITEDLLTISVANVDSLEKYVHAREYMAQMSIVKAVSLIEQEGSVATFSLTLRSRPDDFYKVIKLDSRLKPVTDAAGNRLEGQNFYWNE